MKNSARSKQSNPVSPYSVTQVNADAVLGINARRYLEACRVHRDVLRPAKIGKLVLTTIEAWERLMAHLAETGGDLPEEPTTPANDAPEPSNVDDILGRVGLRRRAS